MKKLNVFWFIVILCLVSFNSFSQNIGDLKGIHYQAVAVDEDGKEIVGMDVEGKPLYEKAIGVRFTITKGLDGTVQYEETHTVTTDKYGLFSVTIGLGEQTGGTYDHLMEIPWIDADQFLKVEISIKNDGNYRMVSNQQFMSVPYSFYTNDIADNAITTEKILNNTILNEDIADGTIDLTTKVTGILPVEHGGTGDDGLTDGGILIGGGDEPIRALPRAEAGQITVGATDSDPVLKNLTGGTGIEIDQEDEEVIIRTTVGDVESTGVHTISPGQIQPGETWTSASFPVPGDGTGEMGDIVLASLDVNLQGCMLTPYFFSSETIKVAIFNGTGGAVNLGDNVDVKLLIVQ